MLDNLFPLTGAIIATSNHTSTHWLVVHYCTLNDEEWWKKWNGWVAISGFIWSKGLIQNWLWGYHRPTLVEARYLKHFIFFTHYRWWSRLLCRGVFMCSSSCLNTRQVLFASACGCSSVWGYTMYHFFDLNADLYPVRWPTRFPVHLVFSFTIVHPGVPKYLLQEKNNKCICATITLHKHLLGVVFGIAAVYSLFVTTHSSDKQECKKKT